MPDQLVTTAEERFASAGRLIHSQRIASLRLRTASAQTRQQITVIDDLIGVLEERNLDGERRVDRALRKRLRQLEAQVAVPIPRKVHRARNTARMHGALLDWMETVLDELLPHRCLPGEVEIEGTSSSASRPSSGAGGHEMAQKHELAHE